MEDEALKVTITIKNVGGVWTCDPEHVSKSGQKGIKVSWETDPPGQDWEVEFEDPDHPLEDKNIKKAKEYSKLKDNALVRTHKYRVIKPTPGEDPDLIVENGPPVGPPDG